MTRQEIMEADGNVLKVKLGNRTIYLALEHMHGNSIRGNQVDKEGAVRYSKWSNIYNYTVFCADVVEVLPIYAESIF